VTVPAQYVQASEDFMRFLVARFAGALPPVLRAIFVAGWDPTEPERAFDDGVMAEEVRSLRPLHNYASETSIHDVAFALRKNVDEAAFDRSLALLPAAAVRFWHA